MKTTCQTCGIRFEYAKAVSTGQVRIHCDTCFHHTTRNVRQTTCARSGCASQTRAGAEFRIDVESLMSDRLVLFGVALVCSTRCAVGPFDIDSLIQIHTTLTSST